MIIDFKNHDSNYRDIDPMIFFQGMQITVTINDDTIRIKPIGGDREDITLVSYFDSKDAMADFKRINIALSYNKTDNPEMFL